MTVKFIIDDGSGKGAAAQVTSRGELVVGSLRFSQSYSTQCAVINQAYNLVGPSTNERFVITEILISTNNAVGVNGSVVDIYEASSESSTTIDRTILQLEVNKQTSVPITGINLIVTEGKWINAKVSDNSVYVVVMGYFVSA